MVARRGFTETLPYKRMIRQPHSLKRGFLELPTCDVSECQPVNTDIPETHPRTKPRALRALKDLGKAYGEDSGKDSGKSPNFLDGWCPCY